MFYQLLMWSLRPVLLWLTQNLTDYSVLITKSYIFFFQILHPVRCFRVILRCLEPILGVHIRQADLNLDLDTCSSSGFCRSSFREVNVFGCGCRTGSRVPEGLWHVADATASWRYYRGGDEL
jgi:hypothetical protein